MEYFLKFLSALKLFPLWFLSSLSVVSIIIFSFFHNKIPQNLQSLALFAVILFSVLTVFCIIDKIIKFYLNLHTKKANCPVKIIPIPHRCYWVSSLQKDGNYNTQVVIDFEASNTTGKPLRLMSCKLKTPRNVKIIQTMLLVRSQRNGLSSHEYPIPPNNVAEGGIRILTAGKVAKENKPLKTVIEIIDQTGFKQRIKLVCNSR